MSAEFESGMFVREPAWHRLGVVVDEAPNVEEAIKLAGLDWEVRKEPVHFKVEDEEVEVPNRFAVVRSTDDKPLGIVSDRYEPLQNTEAFKFFNPFLEYCDFNTAGSLREGKNVWILAKLRLGS
jgi:phage/plasmid-like protein (TIGR03299 family)